jgi:hypothetical protein
MSRLVIIWTARRERGITLSGAKCVTKMIRQASARAAQVVPAAIAVGEDGNVREI